MISSTKSSGSAYDLQNFDLALNSDLPKSVSRHNFWNPRLVTLLTHFLFWQWTKHSEKKWGAGDQETKCCGIFLSLDLDQWKNQIFKVWLLVLCLYGNQIGQKKLWVCYQPVLYPCWLSSTCGPPEMGAVRSAGCVAGPRRLGQRLLVAAWQQSQHDIYFHSLQCSQAISLHW